MILTSSPSHSAGLSNNAPVQREGNAQYEDVVWGVHPCLTFDVVRSQSALSTSTSELGNSPTLVGLTTMSNTIDLTSESPPRSALTLPRGQGPAAGSSNQSDADRRHHTHIALDLSGDDDDDSADWPALQQQRASEAGPSRTQRQRRPMTPSASDEGFEVTGVTQRPLAPPPRPIRRPYPASGPAGATAAAAAATAPGPSSMANPLATLPLSPSNAQTWAAAAAAGGPPRRPNSMGGVTIHDGLPPGPYHAPATVAEAAAMNGDPSQSSAAGSAGRLNIGQLTALLSRSSQALQFVHRTFGGGASSNAGGHGTAARGRGGSRGGRGGVREGMRAGQAAHNDWFPTSHHSNHKAEKIIPAKHDPRMVLNHHSLVPNVQTGQREISVANAAPGYSFGIVEPPLDVDTFDQDPRIIRGPLPDTSPICAGCDCALVLGADGKRRMWALPCGHIIDGRCYERFCQGMNADEAREEGRKDIFGVEEGPKHSPTAADAPTVQEQQQLSSTSSSSPAKTTAVRRKRSESEPEALAQQDGVGMSPDNRDRNARPTHAKSGEILAGSDGDFGNLSPTSQGRRKRHSKVHRTSISHASAADRIAAAAVLGPDDKEQEHTTATATATHATLTEAGGNVDGTGGDGDANADPSDHGRRARYAGSYRDVSRESDGPDVQSGHEDAHDSLHGLMSESQAGAAGADSSGATTSTSSSSRSNAPSKPPAAASASSSKTNNSHGRKKKTTNVKTFACPVDGCIQRVNTTSGKPASAIPLYV